MLGYEKYFGSKSIRGICKMEIIVFAYWLIYFFLNLRRNNSLGLRLFGSMFNSIIRNKNKLQKPKNMYKVALGSRLLVSKAFKVS